jgi:hypothetical protein
MEQQQAQQIESQLRQRWQQVRYRILDQFPQVCAADLDPARSVGDLVDRIAHRSRHTRRYVETRLLGLVSAGSAGQDGPFGVAPAPADGAQEQSPALERQRRHAFAVADPGEAAPGTITDPGEAAPGAVTARPRTPDDTDAFWVAPDGGARETSRDL